MVLFWLRSRTVQVHCIGVRGVMLEENRDYFPALMRAGSLPLQGERAMISGFGRARDCKPPTVPVCVLMRSWSPRFSGLLGLGRSPRVRQGVGLGSFAGCGAMQYGVSLAFVGAKSAHRLCLPLAML